MTVVHLRSGLTPQKSLRADCTEHRSHRQGSSVRREFKPCPTIDGVTLGKSVPPIVVVLNVSGSQLSMRNGARLSQRQEL